MVQELFWNGQEHTTFNSLPNHALIWRNESDIEIWLKQNGVDYPNSTTAITLQANAQKNVPAWTSLWRPPMPMRMLN
jgi:hypothetical protein